MIEIDALAANVAGKVLGAVVEGQDLRIAYIVGGKWRIKLRGKPRDWRAELFAFCAGFAAEGVLLGTTEEELAQDPGVTDDVEAIASLLKANDSQFEKGDIWHAFEFSRQMRLADLLCEEEQDTLRVLAEGLARGEAIVTDSKGRITLQAIA